MQGNAAVSQEDPFHSRTHKRKCRTCVTNRLPEGMNNAGKHLLCLLHCGHIALLFLAAVVSATAVAETVAMILNEKKVQDGRIRGDKGVFKRPSLSYIVRHAVKFGMRTECVGNFALHCACVVHR